MSMIERILDALHQNNKNMADLSRAIGVSTSSIANWKTRKTDPPAKYIFPICEFLNVSCEYILTGQKPVAHPEQCLTEEQNDLLQGFSSLNKQERQIILGKIAEMNYEKKGQAEMSSEIGVYLAADFNHVGKLE